MVSEVVVCLWIWKIKILNVKKIKFVVFIDVDEVLNDWKELNIVYIFKDLSLGFVVMKYFKFDNVFKFEYF